MLNIAILGAGFMGESHINGFNSLNSDAAKYVAVCDADMEKAEKFAEGRGLEVFTCLVDMLEKEDIDIIDLCLPSHLHEEFAIKICRAKKHILVEKPIAFTVAAAKRMYDAARENGVRMMTAQALRFWPEYSRIKELKDAGVLGDIKHIYAARLGQVPNWGGGWYNDPAKSGECLLNFTLHDIDYLHYLMGSPKSVYAAGVKDEYGCYNDVFNVFKWENGVNAVVDGSLSMTPGYPFSMRLRVAGTKATVEFSFTSGVNIGPDSASSLMLYVDGKNPEKIEIEQYDGYGKEVDYFARCVQEGKETELVTEDSVLDVLESVELSKQSIIDNEVKAK